LGYPPHVDCHTQFDRCSSNGRSDVQCRHKTKTALRFRVPRFHGQSKPPTGGTYVLGLPIDVPKQPRPYLVLFTRYSETLAENCYISELTVSLVFDTTADGIQLGIL